jgi:hypothetical protein
MAASVSAMRAYILYELEWYRVELTSLGFGLRCEFFLLLHSSFCSMEDMEYEEF